MSLIAPATHEVRITVMACEISTTLTQDIVLPHLCSVPKKQQPNLSTQIASNDALPTLVRCLRLGPGPGIRIIWFQSGIDCVFRSIPHHVAFMLRLSKGHRPTRGSMALEHLRLSSYGYASRLHNDGVWVVEGF